MTARHRSRASAKKAGTAHETAIATYLAEHLDDRIERRTRNGGKDRGTSAAFDCLHLGAAAGSSPS